MIWSSEGPPGGPAFRLESWAGFGAMGVFWLTPRILQSHQALRARAHHDLEPKDGLEASQLQGEAGASTGSIYLQGDLPQCHEGGGAEAGAKP